MGFRRAWVYAAALFYVIAMAGCLLYEEKTPGAGSGVSGDTVTGDGVTAGSIHGAAMQIQRVDWMMGMSEDNKRKSGHGGYKEAIDEMKALGANYFLCVVDARQENGSSSYIYLDMRKTPSFDQLGDMIDYVHQVGLKVALMPIVLLDHPRKNEWRGTINPDSWSDWWDSYQGVMAQFSWIAESHKVELLVVGSELVSTETHVDDWNKTIAGIKDAYHGMLTYSSNWDHYQSVPFWDQMDVIGMNCYWKLGEDQNATVGEITDHWEKIQVDLRAFCNKKEKKLLLLEAGWCSLANAASEPWDYTQSSLPADPDLQKRLWEGFYDAWQGQDWMAGYMVWAWEPGDTSGDKGYCPKGKPAYDVIKTRMAMPWKKSSMVGETPLGG